MCHVPPSVVVVGWPIIKDGRRSKSQFRELYVFPTSDVGWKESTGDSEPRVGRVPQLACGVEMA